MTSDPPLPCDMAAQQQVLAGKAAEKKNDPLKAMVAYARALELAPEHPVALSSAVAILERTKTSAYKPVLARLIQHCLRSPLGNKEALAAPACHQLKYKYHVPDWAGDSSLANLAADQLLLSYLCWTINVDAEFELFLIRLRRELALALDKPEVALETANLAAAMALQAFNNEYVWPLTGEEAARLDGLQAEWHAVPEKAAKTPNQLLLYALYAPLRSLPRAEDHADRPLQEWSMIVQAVVARTLLEPLHEERLKSTITPLTTITDSVSSKVRQMYEANPYPRWVSLTPGPAVDFRTVLRHKFAHLAPLPDSEGPLRVLMPGAGTGRHALLVASRYRNVQVTAIDLSLASLAYGKRMAACHGIDNIVFHQGDILQLGQLGEDYDLIECIGVLHHMEDPERGFDNLMRCLRPGGAIQVMLYARSHREQVIAFRKTLGDKGRSTDIESVRALRQEIIRGDGAYAALRDMTNRPDFYSTSAFHDLLLHVQEVSFTVSRVRRMVETAGATFVGFEFTTGRVMEMTHESKAQRLYRQAYPGEVTLSDLSNWESLEAKHPRLFNNYFFWCQKPADAPIGSVS